MHPDLPDRSAAGRRLIPAAAKPLRTHRDRSQRILAMAHRHPQCARGRSDAFGESGVPWLVSMRPALAIGRPTSRLPFEGRRPRVPLSNNARRTNFGCGPKGSCGFSKLCRTFSLKTFREEQRQTLENRQIGPWKLEICFSLLFIRERTCSAKKHCWLNGRDAAVPAHGWIRLKFAQFA